MGAMTEIYPLPIGLAGAASTRPALHAALKTLGQLGYRFESASPALAIFTASSQHYPAIQIHLTEWAIVFIWDTRDCEDERLRDSASPAQGQEIALRAVASAINARRSATR